MPDLCSLLVRVLHVCEVATAWICKLDTIDSFMMGYIPMIVFLERNMTFFVLCCIIRRGVHVSIFILFRFSVMKLLLLFFQVLLSNLWVMSTLIVLVCFQHTIGKQFAFCING